MYYEKSEKILPSSNEFTNLIIQLESLEPHLEQISETIRHPQWACSLLLVSHY